MICHAIILEGLKIRNIALLAMVNFPRNQSVILTTILFVLRLEISEKEFAELKSESDVYT